MKTIVRSKGGTEEREVPINELQIPDLWHVAMYLKKNEPTLGYGDGTPAWQAVLNCWYLCHDLLRTIRE